MVDSFTPFSEADINWSDEDLGAGGVLLLPDQAGDHPHLLVEVGKQGIVYLVDRDNMGAFAEGEDHIVQRLTGQVLGLWSTPAYWNGHVYFAGAGDKLKSFSLTNGLLSWSADSSSDRGYRLPGSFPCHLGQRQRGRYCLDGGQQCFWKRRKCHSSRSRCERRLSNALFFSQSPARDDPGGAIKFVVPTVANGKVYVGANRVVSVYGLLLSWQPTAAAPVFNPGAGVLRRCSQRGDHQFEPWSIDLLHN